MNPYKEKNPFSLMIILRAREQVYNRESFKK